MSTNQLTPLARLLKSFSASDLDQFEVRFSWDAASKSAILVERARRSESPDG